MGDEERGRRVQGSAGGAVVEGGKPWDGNLIVN